jgi:hypothetical protein
LEVRVAAVTVVVISPETPMDRIALLKVGEQILAAEVAEVEVSAAYLAEAVAAV